MISSFSQLDREGGVGVFQAKNILAWLKSKEKAIMSHNLQGTGSDGTQKIASCRHGITVTIKT